MIERRMKPRKSDSKTVYNIYMSLDGLKLVTYLSVNLNIIIYTSKIRI